jgi:RNA polymerase sigma-70 factor (ECF subfamily)
VYGTALRIVRAHDVADDVAQEAFVRAWRSLDRFELGRPFGPWVCRIAANLAVNHVRSPRAREEGLPEGHAETPSADPGPLGIVLDAEAKRVLDAAVAGLSPEQRAVFVLRVVEEMTYAEIAGALGISPGTVMSRLFRARERLAKTLAPYVGMAAIRRKAGAS